MCPLSVHTEMGLKAVRIRQGVPRGFSIHSFNRFMSQGTIPGAGDLVINKWAMVYNLMELTHKQFCLKILYNQRYLCTDHMTTVCHSINLSDMTWICKNLVLKLLDLQEGRTLALNDKSQKEFGKDPPVFNDLTRAMCSETIESEKSM